MSGVNKVILVGTDAELRRLYLDDKLSIPAISGSMGIPRSTVRDRLIEIGVPLRSRAEGIRLVDLSAARTGKRRAAFTDEHRRRIGDARREHAEAHAKGARVTTTGYSEHTRGEHKGRHVHDTVMEARLGRRLLPDEVVHHIDGDKMNNDENNLALMTRSGHTRLHRRERRLFGAK